MSFGFLSLLRSKDVKIGEWRLFKRRIIPGPNDRLGESWNAGFAEVFWAFRYRTGRWACFLFYFLINCYILVVTVIPPYVDGKGKPLEVQGWWYAAVVGVVIGAAILYYCLVIGLTGSNPNRSILRAAGLETRMNAAQEHDAKYGYRKFVQLSVSEDSEVRCVPLWIAFRSTESEGMRC